MMIGVCWYFSYLLKTWIGSFAGFIMLLWVSRYFYIHEKNEFWVCVAFLLHVPVFVPTQVKFTIALVILGVFSFGGITIYRD